MRTAGIPRRGPLVVLAFAGELVLSAPAFLAAQGLSGADLEAQKGISSAFVRNVLARDWDAVAAMYAEDAILGPPNQPAVKGRAAIRAWFSSFPPVTAFTAADVRIDGHGDLAYGHGTFEITVMPPGAAGPIKNRGKYLDVRKKQKDGRWLYVVDFWSSDLPQQGAN
jgi:ketosteroid isomerase-like protein